MSKFDSFVFLQKNINLDIDLDYLFCEAYYNEEEQTFMVFLTNNIDVLDCSSCFIWELSDYFIYNICALLKQKIVWP